MKKFRRSAGNRANTRVRVGAVACVLLGVFWAVSPVFHGFFHVAQIAHRHPSGSVHQHTHAQAAVHQHAHADGHAHSHDAHDHAPGGSHAHPAASGSEQQGDEPDGQSKGEDRTQPEPAEGNPLIVFLTIEIASSANAVFDVHLSEPSLPLAEEVFENIGIGYAANLGASGPRGPPTA